MYIEPSKERAIAVDHACSVHELREERRMQREQEESASDSEKMSDIEIAMWDKAAESEGGAGEVLLDMNIDFENSFQYLFHLHAFDRKHGTKRVASYLDAISSKITEAAKNIFEFGSNTFKQL